MKNTFISGLSISFIFLSFALTGCSKSEKELVRENAEKYLERTLDNASSYEFVHLEYVEEISQRDNLNYRIKKYKSDLREAEARKKREEESSYTMQSSLDWAEEDITRYSTLIPMIEAFKENLGEKLNETACYVYEFDFRASNPLGATVLTQSYLYITPNLDVTHIAITSGQILNTCNELEEYYDLVRSNM